MRHWVNIMKKCPFCSSEILDDAEFCLHCMRQLNPKTVVFTPTRKPKILIPVLIAVIVLVIYIIFLISVINNFRTRSKSNDSDETLSTISSDTESEGNADKEDIVSFENAPVQDDNVVVPAAPSDALTPDIDIDTPTDETSDTDDPTLENTPTTNEHDNDNTIEQPSEKTPDTPQETVVVPQPTVWSVKDVDGGVKITGIENYIDSGIYEIPSQIDGKTVVGIGSCAFYYEQSIKSITLPDTLQFIDDQAFAYCNSLTQITIPASVTKIGTNAFLPCENLADIYIKSTNISIANYAFSSSYQRNVSLTIHAPAGVIDVTSASLFWNAEYEEWNG